MAAARAKPLKSRNAIIVLAVALAAFLAYVAWSRSLQGRAPPPSAAAINAAAPPLVGNPTHASPGAPTMRPFELQEVDAERGRDAMCMRTGACVVAQ